jgi:hypothetical protein
MARPKWFHFSATPAHALEEAGPDGSARIGGGRGANRK